MNSKLRAHRLGLAAGAAAMLAVGLAAASPAAAATSASVSNDTLTVNGDSGDDRIALRLAAGAAGTLQVDFGDDGSAEHSFDRSTFSRIEVFTGSGNDRFRVDQANGAFTDEALTVDGGNGHDTLDGGDESSSSSAATAVMRSTATAATTPHCSGTDGTSSVGTRVTAAMSSRARTAPTHSTSTEPA